VGEGPGSKRYGEGRGGVRAARSAAVAAVAATAAAVALTWYRLWQGIDLNDEAGWLVVPWRWALGDTPFVDEENLAQIPGFLVYPFVKAFALVRDYDVTGLVLYGRHLYLLMALGVAVVAFLVLRRLIRWELALLIAALCVAFLSRDTPQVTSTTMAAALLTLGSLLGLRAVIEPPSRRWAAASGAAFGLAVVAYPTLLFVIPFFAVFLAFALGRRAVAMIAEGAFASPPDPLGPPTGRPAWLVLSAWALGGAAVLVPMGLIIASFGMDNLVRCWRYTLIIGRELGQLGGAAKAYQVAAGFWAFVWSRPYLVVAAIAVYAVYRWRPLAGRALLAGLPVGLWLAGQRPGLGTAGFVLIYAALAPYLYLFVPPTRRAAGARILIWVWAPTILAGVMAAYTSSLGYVHASMGVFPGVLASALFLAWALEEVRTTSARVPIVAIAVLVAILAVTVSFQFRQQARLAPQATIRFSDGPWWGISASLAEYEFVSGIGADLAASAHAGDALLVFYGAPGVYLFWDGDIAANSYWIRPGEGGQMGTLPAATVAYFKRRHEVPTVAIHFVTTADLSAEELQAGCGGLDYPPILVRPGYAVHRKPPLKTVDEVLAGFSR
jgi:hypothetical protein